MLVLLTQNRNSTYGRSVGLYRYDEEREYYFRILFLVEKRITDDEDLEEFLYFLYPEDFREQAFPLHLQKSSAQEICYFGSLGVMFLNDEFFFIEHAEIPLQTDEE